MNAKGRNSKPPDRIVYSIDTMTKEEAEELLAAVQASLRELPETDEFDHELEGWTPEGE